MQTECNDTPICPIRLPYFSYRTKTSIRQVQLKSPRDRPETHPALLEDRKSPMFTDNKTSCKTHEFCVSGEENPQILCKNKMYYLNLKQESFYILPFIHVNT